MTDPTPPHRRSPLEHERDACPYCAEGALTIAHLHGVASERERTAARIEALEAENGRLRGALARVNVAVATSDEDPETLLSWIETETRAALKGEGE